MIYTEIQLGMRGAMSEMLQLLRRGGRRTIRIVLFADCADEQSYMELYRELHSEVMSIWEECDRPIINLVAQKPLNCEIALETTYCDESEGVVEVCKSEGCVRVVLLKAESGTWYFIGELLGGSPSLVEQGVKLSIEKQADLLFDNAMAIFNDLAIPIDAIVRQWNYIEGITKMEGGNQHYQLFNNARSKFYDSVQWRDGYPAATGIGALSGGIRVDMDIFIPTAQSSRVEPIDNKLQIAAHAYSEGVLFDANANKSTPKFERAKSVEYSKGAERHKIIYVSGTAAITGEQSLMNEDGAKQTLATLNNIDQLIDSRSDIDILRVYVKSSVDYLSIKGVMEQQLPQMPSVLYTVADVCREELLVEIEGVATN